MKRIIFSCLFAMWGIGLTSQTTWKKIPIGHSTNTGTSKLIVKNKCFYIFNRNHSTLLRSRDVGLTWDLISIPSDSLSHEYTDVCFVNDSTGFLAGYDGSCYAGVGGSIRSIIKVTHDYGATWTASSTGLFTNSILTNISFFNENVGVAFGTAKMQTEKFMTIDGGASWMYMENFKPEMMQVNSSSFMGMGGVVSGVGHYLHLSFTYDQGSTWETRHFHGSNTANALQFFDVNEGVVIGNDSIYFTTDGARSFAKRSKFPFSPCIKSFAMLDMDRGFFSTHNAIYYTVDAGKTWELSYSSPQSILEDIVVNGSDIYASTCYDNFILKLDVSKVANTGETLKAGLDFQVFPNPANDRLTIRSSETISSVSMVDASGKTVKVLRDKIEEITLSDVPAGIYFVLLETPQHVSSHKLVVVK